MSEHDPLVTMAGVAGQLLKPLKKCICGSGRSWKLETLRVFPGGADGIDERQRSAWTCDACDAYVVCCFEPQPHDVANTRHPENESEDEGAERDGLRRDLELGQRLRAVLLQAADPNRGKSDTSGLDRAAAQVQIELDKQWDLVHTVDSVQNRAWCKGAIWALDWALNQLEIAKRSSSNPDSPDSRKLDAT